ncbi:phosphatidylglycerophosphatase C [Methylomarinovum caldicuralii]|uniref:Phosphatidylglycerophosphatase C n=1 Tax=Methylomarinovum caldicuralii TaxID=438856 RepID=A0AAU9CDA5_9GAMM|nr:HAD-IB family hydrolase [Methylomarinovum caldicuralii]BCX80915.1 phosphatidylglycerophosphatase C [Methylomarinovum caldicuralii]
MKTTAALFDFDGTLTRGDSLLPFLRQVRGPLRLGMDFVRTSPWLAGYALKLLDNGRAKEALLARTLGGLPWEQVAEHGARFAKERIPALLRPDTLERLHWHQSQGHLCILISASLDVYLNPWAQSAGFDFCLTSVLERDRHDRVTGRLVGGNCHGAEKVRRIDTLFAQIGRPEKIYAYGDSPGDRAMLEQADVGIWV